MFCFDKGRNYDIDWTESSPDLESGEFGGLELYQKESF